MAQMKLVLLMGAALTACARAQSCRAPPGNVPVGGCQVTENGKTAIIANTDETTCESYVGCCWNSNFKICLNKHIVECHIKKNAKSVIITTNKQSVCEGYNECCWKNNKCLSKTLGDGCPANADERKFTLPKKSARFLTKQPPPICTFVPKPFPSECTYMEKEPYVIDPPLDIPYCVRIPCSLDQALQKAFDISQYQCGIQPGCYFDNELSEFRKDFGPAVLAGVPVCHFAIRNAVFHREAQKVVASTGSWNPYYTNCLLKTFDQNIREQPEGCKLINILKVFNILPKLAGWDGITSYECILIDGCWRNTEGCFYPVDVERIIVKSNQRFMFNKFEVTYGRPKCQHFNDENPYEFLKSYHQCLAAGCSIDANIAATYYNNLFEIGNYMTPNDQWEYWAQVQRGKIGSDNIEKGIYWNFDKTFGKDDKSPNSDSPPAPFQPPGVNPAVSTEGSFFPPNPFGLPAIPDVQTSENTRCGSIYKKQGYRPCPPESPHQYNPSNWCPYKPFIVPRFDPLKGSFRGCCDINPCYLSRRDIRKMHSGPSFYYSEWTLFSYCSVTCGSGTQKRSRQCITHDESLCTKKTEEERPCFDQPCGNWGYWSPYPSCDYKFQLVTRKRTCSPPEAVCGPNQLKEEDENQYCP